MGYPRDFIDTVRRSVDALEVVGEVVALKQRGTRWVGLCPFHDEKTPSFTVDPQEGLWYCFGCQAGGDLLRFVQDTEAIGFSDAVRSLAERAGVPIPEQEARVARVAPRATDPRRLMEALAAADDFYREQLAVPGGAVARDFLWERDFQDEIVARFGLGFAPDAWDALFQHLTKRGFAAEELETAGLVKRRDTGSGHYDRLRKRVVFPIRDLRGRTIGFGGRIIADGEPKYLNSPETPTFHKSRVLYGLHEAREAIAATGFAMLVEGYFDLLACAQYGLANAVAPLGTSFTEQHARLLARFTRKAVVVFDGDTAGRAAAERTVGTFLSQGFQVNVVRLPAEHDPDSFLRAAGIDGYRDALRKSESGLEHLISAAGERADLRTPRGKAEALASLLEFVVPINDRVERAEWIGRLAERLELDARLVEQAAREVAAKAGRRQGPAPPPENRSQPRQTDWRATLEKVTLAERELLRAVIEHPEWRERLASVCSPDAIRDRRVRALLAAAAACEAAGEPVEIASLIAHCDEPGAAALLSRLCLEESEPLDWDGARNCALGIHDDSLRRRLKEMNKDIHEALQAGDQERFSELNREKVTLAQRIGSA